MHRTTHDTQVYSPFGGGYVAEEHGGGFAFDEGKKNASSGKLALVLVALLVGATTAGAAITVTRNQATEASLTRQTLPSFQMKIPGTAWFEDAVY
jgi:hypothetical protein